MLRLLYLLLVGFPANLAGVSRPGCASNSLALAQPMGAMKGEYRACGLSGVRNQIDSSPTSQTLQHANGRKGALEWHLQLMLLIGPAMVIEQAIIAYSCRCCLYR